MTATAFDTNKALTTLTDSGMPDKQAKAHLEVLMSVTDNLATKADIEFLHKDIKSSENRVNAKVESLEDFLVTKLDSAVYQLKAELWRQQFMTIVITLGAGFAALKFFLDKVV